MSDPLDEIRKQSDNFDPFTRIQDIASSRFEEYVLIAKVREKDNGASTLRWAYSEPLWAIGAITKINEALLEGEVLGDECKEGK